MSLKLSLCGTSPDILYHKVDIFSIPEDSREEKLLMELSSSLKSTKMYYSYTRSLTTPSVYGLSKSRLIESITTKYGKIATKSCVPVSDDIFFYKPKGKLWAVYVF